VVQHPTWETVQQDRPTIKPCEGARSHVLHWTGALDGQGAPSRGFLTLRGCRMVIDKGRLARWIEVLNRAYERRDWDRVDQVIGEMERDIDQAEENRVRPPAGIPRPPVRGRRGRRPR
jgi:hypothetical protein